MWGSEVKLKVFPVHDMKAYRGRKVIAPFILNHCTGWWSFVKFTPRSPYPRDKNPSSHLIGSCAGIRVGLVILDSRKTSCPCRDPKHVPSNPFEQIGFGMRRLFPASLLGSRIYLSKMGNHRGNDSRLHVNLPRSQSKTLLRHVQSVRSTVILGSSVQHNALALRLVLVSMVKILSVGDMSHYYLPSSLIPCCLLLAVVLNKQESGSRLYFRVNYGTSFTSWYVVLRNQYLGERENRTSTRHVMRVKLQTV